MAFFGLAPVFFGALFLNFSWGLSIVDDVRDPATLDPQRQFSEKNHTIIQQMFEGLVRFSPEGKIEPALAVSWKRIDPLTMEFRLRKRVRFHNGEPFDARSVLFSIERYLKPETEFPAAGFIAPLKSAEIVDSHTVRLKTEYPDGLLLRRLAGFVVIVPPDYYATASPKTLAGKPVGTGPFRFVSWTRGKGVRMKANKDYWMDGFPKLKFLLFKFLPWEKQVDELLAGRVDILTELPGTRTREVVEHPATKVVKKETFYTVFASLNAEKGPLRDIRLRRAINYAIHRGDIIRYDVLGNGRELASITMPGEEGHNPKLKPYPHDIKRAKRLMKDAGYSKGLKLRALVKEQGIRTGKIIRRQLERIGIDLEITISKDAEGVKDISSSTWDVYLGGCPDPMVHSFFIQSIFFFGKSPYAIAKYPEFDRMLGEMVVTLDSKERARKAHEIDAYIHEKALGIFTYQRIKTFGVRKGTTFVPSITGMPYFLHSYKEGDRDESSKP